MSTEIETPTLTTADLVATAAQSQTATRVAQPLPKVANADRASSPEDEPLAALFLPADAAGFRASWDAVQIGFVDDPRQAVRKADELVAQVMKTLAETFSNERAKLESQVDESEQGSTENLRVALRRYRSFFQRLLAL